MNSSNFNYNRLVVDPPVFVFNGAHGINVAVKEHEVGHAGMMVAYNGIGAVEGSGQTGTFIGARTAASAIVAVVIEIDELRRLFNLGSLAHPGRTGTNVISPPEIGSVTNGRVVEGAQSTVVANEAAGDA